MSNPYRISFVCMGNICRSPTAAAVMNHLITDQGLDHHIVIESAGTDGWHVGEGADRRAVAEANRRGVAMPHLAQRFDADDFDRFDLILAMDDENVDALVARAPDPDAVAKIRLLREYDPESPVGAIVPDPYYGGADGFAAVYEMCEAACRGLIDHLRSRGLAP